MKIIFSELRFSVATLFRFVARFARVRIEDSSFNRFALNGIQRDFFGGIFSVYPYKHHISSTYLLFWLLVFKHVSGKTHALHLSEGNTCNTSNQYICFFFKFIDEKWLAFFAADKRAGIGVSWVLRFLYWIYLSRPKYTRFFLGNNYSRLILMKLFYLDWGGTY